VTGFYWIASYPKSGNTWLRLALHALLSRGPLDFRRPVDFAPVVTGCEEFERVLGLLSADLPDAEIERLRPVVFGRVAAAARTPQFRKVHDAWGLTANGPLFPPDITLGTLYVVRDPRDVALSLSHYIDVPPQRAIELLSEDRTTHQSPRSRLGPQLPCRTGTWSDHVTSWLDAPGRPCCQIRFEDMLADPARELRRAADYAGIECTADAVSAAVRATRFDRLAADEREHGFLDGRRGVPFFRSGRSGGWREILTPGQVERLETDHRAVMQRLGYL
jgi:hypothetical protein